MINENFPRDSDVGRKIRQGEIYEILSKYYNDMNPEFLAKNFQPLNRYGNKYTKFIYDFLKKCQII